MSNRTPDGDGEQQPFDERAFFADPDAPSASGGADLSEAVEYLRKVQQAGMAYKSTSPDVFLFTAEAWERFLRALELEGRPLQHRQSSPQGPFPRNPVPYESIAGVPLEILPSAEDVRARAGELMKAGKRPALIVDGPTPPEE